MIIKNTGKRVNRMAHKIIAVKEDMDVLSWTRVIELSKLIQIEEDKDIRHELAEELRMLAQLHLSVFGRMGITLPEGETQKLASGIEVERPVAEAPSSANQNEHQAAFGQNAYSDQSVPGFNPLSPSTSGSFGVQGAPVPPNVSGSFAAQGTPLASGASGSFAPLDPRLSPSVSGSFAAQGASVSPNVSGSFAAPGSESQYYASAAGVSGSLFSRSDSLSGSIPNLSPAVSASSPSISGPVVSPDVRASGSYPSAANPSLSGAIPAVMPFSAREEQRVVPQGSSSFGVSSSQSQVAPASVSTPMPMPASAFGHATVSNESAPRQMPVLSQLQNSEAPTQMSLSAEAPISSEVNRSSISAPATTNRESTDDYLAQMKARMEALREQVQLLNEAVAVSDSDDSFELFDEQAAAVQAASKSVTDFLTGTSSSHQVASPVSAPFVAEKAVSAQAVRDAGQSVAMPTAAPVPSVAAPSVASAPKTVASYGTIPPAAPAVAASAPAPLSSPAASVPLAASSIAASVTTPAPQPEVAPLETVYTSAVGEIIEENSSVEPQPSMREETENRGQFDLSQFSTLYQSRDGNLCLFQDGEGHLVAVDANKLV